MQSVYFFLARGNKTNDGFPTVSSDMKEYLGLVNLIEKRFKLHCSLYKSVLITVYVGFIWKKKVQKFTLTKKSWEIN